MNVSLPDGLKTFVESRVGELGYSTSSEYVRELIRRDQARTELRALVLEGLASGPGPELTDAYFESLRDRIRSDVA